MLNDDDSRLVVTDYFLNEDAAGIIHFEGDHKVHVLKVTHDTLTEDKRFKLDFNTAFKTGPARPHGIAMIISSSMPCCGELESLFHLPTGLRLRATQPGAPPL